MAEDDWLEHARVASDAASGFVEAARLQAGDVVTLEGQVDKALANTAQRQLHGLAWQGTNAAALDAMMRWAIDAREQAHFSEMDCLILRIGFGEYLHQLATGLPMGQGEIIRPSEFALGDAVLKLTDDPSVRLFMEQGSTTKSRAELARLAHDGTYPSEHLSEELDMIRRQFRQFTERRIMPQAHAWHLADDLIPLHILEEMAALGTFGITIGEEYGGSGLGKLAMCVVSEELSRGWICAGSLGTRSEIAGELIGVSGTEEQKSHWLPKLAMGEVLPTAVFTEPDVGSDLASVRTRATKNGDEWVIQGAKTWITHAARADLMTILARTDPADLDHSGLSIFLAPKTRQTGQVLFPDDGLDGGEIPVLGYRGMREYELTFDGFRVGQKGLLGERPGEGFRQLMRTFESARIQTAARAVGVGRNALELALRYATDRKQFGESLIVFPRVSDKIACMIVELIFSRELTYLAARQKDRKLRCDVIAGMAKLLAARTAWNNADLCVQIHGGTGYALESEASRVLCDARVLSIFEGTAEIQAQVIARGLLSAI